jgi:hypothetical protein
VGRALAQKEEEVVKALFEEAGKSKTRGGRSQQFTRAAKILTGSLLNSMGSSCGCVGAVFLWRVEECKRKGDVYREMKVGAVFLAERGRERSELAPEVWIDTRHAKAVCATLPGARPRVALASCSMRGRSRVDSAEPSRSSC